MKTHALIIVVCLLAAGTAAAQERFPPPDFIETHHALPQTAVPPPRAPVMDYVDVAALAAVLAAGVLWSLKRRSRAGLLVLMVASLAYFGFYRKGCVCPIGAIQNVTLAIADPTYAIPWVVLAFFALPLVWTLFFGRTFCGAACPLGAVQDLLAVRPIKVPGWLSGGLGLLAYAYLGLAVLMAAGGGPWIICQYDPFVALFRFSGERAMLIVGACVLLIGVFVSRPYCRFLCPYGALMRPLSILSRWRVTVTPKECIQCRLCEDACPFGAIREPSPDRPAADPHARLRLTGLLVLLPVLMAGGAGLGFMAGPVLARAHPTVSLARQVALEDSGATQQTTPASLAFRATGRPMATLTGEAEQIINRFRPGGAILGGVLGLIVALKLIALSIRRRRTDYTADRATCLACGRCFDYCPIEIQRRSKVS